MDTRYEQYNESTFEAYCKASIGNATLKGRMEKTRRAAREVSLSLLTDAELCKLYVESSEPSYPAQEYISFTVSGIVIPIHDPELGQALSFLPPKLRNVLLLAYFLNMSDPQIATQLHISKSAAQRRHITALQRLKEQFI